MKGGRKVPVVAAAFDFNPGLFHVQTDTDQTLGDASEEGTPKGVYRASWALSSRCGPVKTTGGIIPLGKEGK